MSFLVLTKIKNYHIIFLPLVLGGGGGGGGEGGGMSYDFNSDPQSEPWISEGEG